MGARSPCCSAASGSLPCAASLERFRRSRPPTDREPGLEPNASPGIGLTVDDRWRWCKAGGLLAGFLPQQRRARHTDAQGVADALGEVEKMGIEHRGYHVLHH